MPKSKAAHVQPALNSYELHPDGSKGNQGLLRLDGHSTIVKHSEIGPGLLASMLKDLGINRKDF